MRRIDYAKGKSLNPQKGAQRSGYAERIRALLNEEKKEQLSTQSARYAAASMGQVSCSAAFESSVASPDLRIPWV